MRRRHPWKLAALTLAGGLVLVACGGEQPSAGGSDPTPTPTASAAPVAVTFPLTISDAMGNEHTFDAPVTKIGCLYYGCMESLADMGIVPNAAPSGDGDIAFLYPNGTPAHEVGDLTNPEEWATTGSELLVNLSSPTGTDDERALKSVAPMFFLNAPYKVWDPDHYKVGVAAWKDDLTMLGQITGKPEAAQEAIDRFDAMVAKLAGMAPEGAATTEVANLLFTDDGTYSLMDPSSPFCEVLGTNGLGTCAEIPGWSVDSWEINAEAFLAADPEWIAYTVYGTDQSNTQRDDPVWKRLTAVKNGQAFDFVRTNCCSLRMLEHALQDYAYNVWGAQGGVPDPGPEDDYDPKTNPFFQGS